MENIILIVLCIISLVISFVGLYRLPSEILKNFEKGCHEAIEERDKEFEEKEKGYILNPL